MGLGKTVMTISVILSNPGRGGVTTDPPVSGLPDTLQLCGSQVGKLSKVAEMKRQSGPRKGGGTLIVCPMTLLGQWKVAVTFCFQVFPSSHLSIKEETCPRLSHFHYSILFMHFGPS